MKYINQLVKSFMTEAKVMPKLQIITITLCICLILTVLTFYNAIDQLNGDQILCNSLNSTNKTNINKAKKAGGSESLKKVDSKTPKIQPKQPQESKQLTLFDFID